MPVTPQAEGGLYTSATLDERTHELIVKAINYSATARPAEIRLNGVNTSELRKSRRCRAPILKRKTASIIRRRWRRSPRLSK